MAAVTICSDFGAQKNSLTLLLLFPHLFPMKWWDRMPWSSFSECWALSQLFQNLKAGPRRTLNWTQEIPGCQELQALDYWGGPANRPRSRKVRSGCLYKNGLGTAPYNDTGLGPTDSTLLRPRIKALNTVVKQHKVDTLLDVSQCMHDPKGETLCLPLDGKMSMKEVLQDGFVGI